MRILHTADWHLGKRLESFSRIEEQREVLAEICEIAEKENIDAVIIAGDLYDAINPPIEAIELFYKTVKRLANNGKRAVFAIAGNHDSPDRIEAPDPLARECGIIFSGYPNSKVNPCSIENGIKILQSEEGFIEMKLPNVSFPLRMLLTPYANELRMKMSLGTGEGRVDLRTMLTAQWREHADKYCDETGVNILAAHLYVMQKGGEEPEEPEDEKPIHQIGGSQEIFSENIPSQIQYVALGHLHRRQTIDKEPCPIVYCSSPLAYSFSESNQDKFVLLVDLEPAEKVKYKSVKLAKGRKLLRKAFEDISLAIEWLKENPEALIELTIKTDKFLSSEDKKFLLQQHSGIITIIPEVKDKAFLESISCHSIDLSKNNEELFKDYFKFKLGNVPNERLLDLFKEAQAETNTQSE